MMILLKNFVARGIPVMGIVLQNVAEVAIENGVATLVKFFGSQTAQELVGHGRQPDLIIGNNVLAHVPDLNDFIQGLKILLGPRSVVTMEFPHLMRLMADNQFDIHLS
jgi:2-polyprenyl-3-methyl-5-hydroxy-6-metoxy-1,4-benzoquinol methylase